MNYSGITTCDVCNGEGIGVVLWVSGCDVRCEDCHNKETWNPQHGKNFDIDALNELIGELERPEINRLTLSGGHPLMPCNREDIKSLISLVRAKYPDISIWLYTGYYYDKNMDKECRQICKMCDVVVDGPFIKLEEDKSLEFRGSKNQHIIRMNKKSKIKK
jgi:anaerobic ribonucleoside-triphosphate reductase activating protein